MANDDILWKNVEAIKDKERAKPRSGRRPQPAGPSLAAKSSPALNEKVREVKPSRLHAITPDGKPSFPGDSNHSRYHDSKIEEIRGTVKRTGKEFFSLRLTAEEKRQLADIAYTFKRQGIRTSENEIARIGLNLLLGDYRDSGKESVLERVIAALNG